VWPIGQTGAAQSDPQSVVIGRLPSGQQGFVHIQTGQLKRREGAWKADKETLEKIERITNPIVPERIPLPEIPVFLKRQKNSPITSS
jgi:hypothetical protein